MTQRIGGLRRKTRHQLRKGAKEKGKFSLTRYLQVFSIGEKVALKAEPQISNGMYNRRFHGRIGTITGKKGKCYAVGVRDGSKIKELIVHPVHLKKVL